MKKYFKKFFLSLLLVLCFVSFLGCKKNETKTKEPTVVPSEKTVEPVVTPTEEIKVPTEKEPVEIEVKANSFSCYVNETIDFDVIIKNSDVSVTDYSVFITNESIFKYENNKLVAISVGKTLVTIACTIDNESVSCEFEVECIEKPYVGEIEFDTNLPETMFVFQKFSGVELYAITSEGTENITDFKVKVSDMDVLDYMKDNSIEAIDSGEVELKFTFNYKGKDYEYVHLITINGELQLNVTYSEVIYIGDTVDIICKVMPEDVEVTDYSLSTTSEFVSINDNVITGVSKGDATVSLKVTYLGTTLAKTLKIKVKENIVPVLKANLFETMFINEEVDVVPYLYPALADITSFTVESSNESVISVTDNKIKALSNGNSTITVKSKYNELDLVYSIDIEVNEFGTFTLSTSDEIYLNQVSSYNALVGSKIVKNVKYSVSDNNILLVNGDAVFAKAKGEATLTVTYTYLNTPYTQSILIKVIEKEYPIERITVSGSNGMLVGSKTELTVTKFPSYGVGEIELSSSDSTIAKVSGNNIEALKTGVVTITAKVKDSEITSSIDITVIQKNEETTASSDTNSASYKEDQVIRYNELLNGVVQTTYISYTKTTLDGDADGYSGITEAIDHDKWYQQTINLLTVPSRTDVKVIPWANLDGNIWNLTTVKGLIENYEKNNPGMKVIAAINGDFFDINAEKDLPYSTTGENISDGEFYKSSNIFGNTGGTIGFTNDGSNLTLIGGWGATTTDKMILAIYDENGEIIKEFEGVTWNSEPGENGTSVWYGIYNSDKEYVSQSVSGNKLFVIENADRAVPNYADDFYGKGTISKIDTSFTLGVGQFAIKTNNSEVDAALSVGTKVRVQFEYTGDWAQVKSATGYNVKVYDDSYPVGGYEGGNLGNRAPRTVVGMRADGTLVMMVVDGRQGAKNMYGCDGWELSAIMQAYGCVKAYNVDGGGSTTMVIRTEDGLQVLNSPSDGRERSDGNCILICSVDPDYKANVTNVTSSSATIEVSTSVSEYMSYPTYIELDGKLYETVDGKVTINNLIHNQTYGYRIYYKAEDVLYKTLSVGTFTTQKANFELLGVTIEETSDAFIINAYCLDMDNSSNVPSMSVNKNGYSTKLNDGTITLQKSIFGELIDDLELKYYYISEGNTINVTLTVNDCFIIK